MAAGATHLQCTPSQARTLVMQAQAPLDTLEVREPVADDLLAFCQGDLASFKIPRAFYFVDTWPMSSTKVQKFKLLETLNDE